MLYLCLGQPSYRARYEPLHSDRRYVVAVSDQLGTTASMWVFSSVVGGNQASLVVSEGPSIISHHVIGVHTSADHMRQDAHVTHAWEN
jgi:hypothetical protein